MQRMTSHQLEVSSLKVVSLQYNCAALSTIRHCVQFCIDGDTAMLCMVRVLALAIRHSNLQALDQTCLNVFLAVVSHRCVEPANDCST